MVLVPEPAQNAAGATGCVVMATGVFTVSITGLLVTAGAQVPLTVQLMLAAFSAVVGFVMVKVAEVKPE